MEIYNLKAGDFKSWSGSFRGGCGLRSNVSELKELISQQNNKGFQSWVFRGEETNFFTSSCHRWMVLFFMFTFWTYHESRVVKSQNSRWKLSCHQIFPLCETVIRGCHQHKVNYLARQALTHSVSSFTGEQRANPADWPHQAAKHKWGWAYLISTGVQTY